MKKTKNLTFTMPLIIILTLSLLIFVFPTITAQEVVYNKTTYAIIGATPNPIGVNQPTLLHIGITDPTQRATDYFTGLTVTVTKPDDTTETLGPFTTDATGGTGSVYVPTMVGIYKLQTHFPAQTYVYDSTSRIPFEGPVLMEASDSPILELVVQEEPRVYYPGNPLPSEYWSRPIHAELREWSPIAGSWLGQTSTWFYPYNDNAPDSSHILWTKDFAMGGLVGGPLGPHAMDCGAAYEQKAQPPLIINGILLYDAFEDRGGDDVEQVAVAVDLHTGEELWRRALVTSEGEVVKIGRYGFGQLFYWDSYNMHSTFAYIWATSGDDWHAFCPYSGRWLYTMKNVPANDARSCHYGPKGELYYYEVDLENGWMALWNSSRVVSNMGSWRPLGNIYNCTWESSRQGGYEWNVSIPSSLPGSINARFYEDKMIGGTLPGTTMIGRDDLPFEMWAISLKPGQEGTLLWNKDWNYPQGDLSFRFLEASQEDGIFTYYAKETQKIYGFSLETGDPVWSTTDSENYLKIYGVRSAVAYGNLYSGYMDGIMYCYDMATGNLKWKYEVFDEYTEILWSDNWPIAEYFITDGKIYMVHGEHSPIDPKPRGGPLICLDAETGEELWKISGMYHYYRMQFVIGDSIIALANTYDQQYYAFGKGPSEITVEAPLMASAWGQKIMLRGTVMDISPGTKDPTIQMRFPKGVPAVSDSSMSEWMNYVYQQHARPMAAGVEVKLQVVVDPNGNWYDIGTTYTDSTGFYKISWEPPVPGEYLILASFAGSDAYYGSYVETAVVVDESPTPGTLMETEFLASNGSEQPTTAPVISAEVAIFVAVAISSIVGLAVYSLLRKK
jgi:outer membrane protein assembly factor BamB